MSPHLSFRAELANQVLVRLRRFDEHTWGQAEIVAEARYEYFGLAYSLAHDAVSLMVEEFGRELHTVLQARLDDVDALMSTLPSFESLERPASRWRVARAAVLAVFLRDSRGFNIGAFQELFAPVAAFIDIGELERTALASLGADTTDYIVGGKQYETPSLAPGKSIKRA
ncbi:MAG: hypothetical protein ACT4P7_18135 [Gemmatimonadaceae bacterium]